MNIINKIAILISWPRELDMLSIFVNDLKIAIIVDDLIYEEKERTENSLNIINVLEKRGLSYVLLSNVLGYSKYRILLSTAQSFQELKTLKSYSKYLYAQTFGRIIDSIGISQLFINIFSRPFNGGGAKAKKFEFNQIERLLGEKVIKFPKGLDVSMTLYPNDRWQGVFDTYLCHSNLDYNLVKKKFHQSECRKIGYPRYDDNTSRKDALSIVYNEINKINRKKPILFWIPAHIKIKSELTSNIKLWLPIVKKLTKNYNVIIRPHPKTLKISPEILTVLKNSGLFIDSKFDRKLSIFYTASDLVLADYGGSVLDSVYMKKKCILLNMPKSYKFSKWREKERYIDEEVRNDILSIDYAKDTDISKQVIDSISCNNENNSKKLKEKYFGIDADYTKIEDFKLDLEKEIVLYQKNS